MDKLIIFMVLTSALTLAVKVPVEYKDSKQEESKIEKKQDSFKNKPIYYDTTQDSVDSYLIAADSDVLDDDKTSDVIATPATYLLPPLPDSHSEYFVPTEPAVQTDWYPIIQGVPKNTVSKFSKAKGTSSQREIPILVGKPKIALDSTASVKDGSPQLTIPIPSRQLEPPADTLPNFFVRPLPTKLELPLIETKQIFSIAPPAKELELPLYNSNLNFNPSLTDKLPIKFQIKPSEPSLALHLIPPEPSLIKYRNPTKLYPKKYANTFKPIPIPIEPYTIGNYKEVPKAKPLKSFKPVITSEEDLPGSFENKQIYNYEKAEQQRKLKQKQKKVNNEFEQDEDEQQNVSEQEASETGHPRLNHGHYPAPIRHLPPQSESKGKPAASPGDRTEFRMHGMKGPHSYQFGFDTGKGKNRQFRYEERDNEGRVKGHYGYMDRHGKLRVVNYDADPEHGFHAEPEEEKEQEP